MHSQNGGRSLRALRVLVNASSALAALLAFLVIIPLTLWFAWVHHSTIAESFVKILFCFSFGWMMVATLQWLRNFQRLHQNSSTRLLLGPRPDDPDELVAWRWGRQFRYAALAVVISMIALGIILHLNGE